MSTLSTPPSLAGPILAFLGSNGIGRSVVLTLVVYLWSTILSASPGGFIGPRNHSSKQRSLKYYTILFWTAGFLHSSAGAIWLFTKTRLYQTFYRTYSCKQTLFYSRIYALLFSCIFHFKTCCSVYYFRRAAVRRFSIHTVKYCLTLYLPLSFVGCRDRGDVLSHHWRQSTVEQY